ncbi:hypothetical protein PYCC9005_000770 [Savitreella phatthalungensis]
MPIFCHRRARPHLPIRSRGLASVSSRHDAKLLCTRRVVLPSPGASIADDVRLELMSRHLLKSNLEKQRRQGSIRAALSTARGAHKSVIVSKESLLKLQCERCLR